MLGRPRSTVGLILRRKGMAKWSALEKKEPPQRYEISEPGGLLHLDTKKLGKIQGSGTGSMETTAFVAGASGGKQPMSA
jgi:hypothetical protein